MEYILFLHGTDAYFKHEPKSVFTVDVEAQNIKNARAHGEIRTYDFWETHSPLPGLGG